MEELVKWNHEGHIGMIDVMLINSRFKFYVLSFDCCLLILCAAATCPSYWRQSANSCKRIYNSFKISCRSSISIEKSLSVYHARLKHIYKKSNKMLEIKYIILIEFKYFIDVI
jgi:hypothetical protein